MKALKASEKPPLSLERGGLMLLARGERRQRGNLSRERGTSHEETVSLLRGEVGSHYDGRVRELRGESDGAVVSDHSERNDGVHNIYCLPII